MDDHAQPPHGEPSASAQAAPLPQIPGGRYHIVEKLSTGAIGAVYKALDTILDRPVAVKCVHLDTPFADHGPDELRERFVREARIAARLQHPNIVTIHDIVATNDRGFIIMEFIEGQSLESLLSKKNRLALPEAIQVVSQLAGALDYAHDRAVVHRDVKPANILVSPSLWVWVTDFGIAKSDLSTNLTMAGGVLGTPDYMSPEQAKGEDVDARSDLFSLGCILFECVTGEKPFRSPSLTGVLLSIINDEPVFPLTWRSLGLPNELKPILHHALEKDRQRRYPTGAELVLALTGLKAGMERPAPAAAAAAPVATDEKKEDTEAGEPSGEAAPPEPTEDGASSAPSMEARSVEPPAPATMPEKAAAAAEADSEAEADSAAEAEAEAPSEARSAHPPASEAPSVEPSGESSPSETLVGSPQPERSARRSGVAEREAVGVGPHGSERSPQPERSARQSRVAEGEAVGVPPSSSEDYGARGRSGSGGPGPDGIERSPQAEPPSETPPPEESSSEAEDEGSSPERTVMFKAGDVAPKLPVPVIPPERIQQLRDEPRPLRLSPNLSSDLHRAEISPEEGFLLSRIDGLSRAGDILSMSPMSEAETAAALLNLLDKALILFGGKTPSREPVVPSAAPPASAPPKPKASPDENTLKELERLLALAKSHSYAELLGIAPNAPAPARKSAYLKIIGTYHPDKFPRASDEIREKLSRLCAEASEALDQLANAPPPSPPASPSPSASAGSWGSSSARPGAGYGNGGSSRDEGVGFDKRRYARELYDRALRAFDIQDFWESIQLCRQAVETDDGRPEYFHLLGRALMQNKKWRKEAADNFRRASDLDPGNLEYLGMLGAIYKAEGLQARANAILKKAQTLDPDYALPEIDGEVSVEAD